MHSINNVWTQVISLENIKAAIKEAAKHKTKRPDVARVLKNIDAHAQIVRDMLVNLAPPHISVEHPELTWKPRKHSRRPRWDSNSRKMRYIQKPDFCYEQIIHHAVMRVLVPFFMRGMYEYNCGSVPKRGPAKGKRIIEHWINHDSAGVKYFAQLDIHHFYENINHDILKAWLAKKIRDKRVLFLLCFIIDTGDKGLPLGFYTSQWLANFLLQPLDHYIKEQLRVPHFLRYMDDMILAGRNKKELHKAVEAIKIYLAEHYQMELKSTHQVFRFEYKDRKGKTRGRALDTMGFVFHRDYTELRERLMLKMTRKARRVSKKEKLTAHDASAIISYMGWVSRTNTYGMYKHHIKPFVNIQHCKRAVATKSRREKKKHDKMDKSIRHANRSPAGA